MATGEKELSGHSRRLTTAFDLSHHQYAGEIAKSVIRTKARG